MGTAAELVATIHKNGIRLWVQEGQLHYRSSAGELSPEYLSEIRARKAELIAFLEQAAVTQKTSAGLTARMRGERMPLSFAQERLWFLEQLGLVGSAYNIPAAFWLEGALHVEALELAFAELLRRHESLRTRFEAVDGQPYQVIDPPGEFHLRVVDLSSLERAHQEEQVQQVIEQALQRPFDLLTGPLFAVLLLRLGPQEHVLQMTMHHIVVDGWSTGVLMRDLSVLYAAYAQGQQSPLMELPIQYADYAMWQRERWQAQVLEKQLEYWKKQLAGAPAILELPTDRPRPAVASFKGGILQFDLSETLCGQLRELANREGVTLYMVLLSAYQIVLSRWSGQSDIVVGSPIAGRMHRELENLMGFFVNTLMFRTQLASEQSFRELLQQVKQTALDAYAHQELPFEKLVAELHPQRDLSRNPICQVLFAMQNMPQSTLEMAGVKLRYFTGTHVTSKWDLTLIVVEEARLQGYLEYAADLFDRATLERLAGHFKTALEGIVANPDCRIGELPLLTAPERRQLMVQWNATAVEYPRDKLVHELFEEQVERTPAATAVVYEGASLTYAQLNGRANQLARYLIRERAVEPDQPVAICVERSLEMAVGLLGILKAGGAYVPIDPNYPSERIAYMLENAASRVVVSQQKLKSMLSGTPARVIALDSEWDRIGGQPDDNLSTPKSVLSARNLVYVIYTSGSTGLPKGTAMTHRSMVNLIEWHRKDFPLRSGQRVLQFAALSFDVAFQETFSTLCDGGTLVLLDEWLRRDPRALTQLLSTQRINRLFVPPLMLQSIAQYPSSGSMPEDLQDVITAGEQLHISSEIVRFFAQLPGCRLHNHYGPTETHVVTALSLTADPGTWPALPAIGRPIANTQIYILDAHWQPVPIGVAGEIYIGGAGVARGYFNRPELTAERFVRDPFNTDPEARLYKTGDLGRWRADGTIQYLGRDDQQVKIRGFRIELGEIEAQLVKHEQVREAVVIAREDVPGDKRLVAHVIPNGDAPGVESLREHLEAVLPQYMVPSDFVLLERLPLTPNGKVDRAALRDINAQGEASEYSAPQTATEEALVAIMCKVLRIEQISRDDDFFSMGGHSLLAVQVIAQIAEAFRLELPLRVLFEIPTVHELAALIDSRRAGASSGEMSSEEFAGEAMEEGSV